MTEVVLDASAVLAVCKEEKGANRVLPYMDTGLLSAVNYSEIIQKLMNYSGSEAAALAVLNQFHFFVAPLDGELARIAAVLFYSTQHLGLSFADRACLALGLKTGFKVLTADSDMAKADIGLVIECIR